MLGRRLRPPGPDRARIRPFPALLAAALPSCALPPRELHLAPLVSWHRTAGGGREFEALAGVLRWKSEGEGTEWAVRPAFRRFREEGKSGIDFLYPLGLDRVDEASHVFYFFPLGWWRRQPDASGRPETDANFVLGLNWGRTGAGEAWFGLFPLYGSRRGFLTYDELRWVLFPLWVETRKEGGWHTRNLLWPFFGLGTREGGLAVRAWPIYGRDRAPDRRGGFVLWPLFQWSEEGDSKSSFLFAPFYGRARDGGIQYTTVLWPFFGWARNEETGFLAVQAPWPLVRLVRRARGGTKEAERLLPLYASTRTPGIRSWTLLFPLLWWREEKEETYARTSFYAVPFLARTALERRDGSREGVTHLWPLFHAETAGEASSFRAPTLLPFPRVRGLYENWESLLAIYDRRERGACVSRRAFADLWRAEEDEEESRWSIPLLAASRRGADGIREWSLLAGLLRFRTGAEGFALLAPAFPGPGFE